MDTERYIVAVEIGSSKITGAIGTRSLKGVVTVLGVDTEPLTMRSLLFYILDMFVG